MNCPVLSLVLHLNHEAGWCFLLFYAVFTEDASLYFLFYQGEKSKMTKNSKQEGPEVAWQHICTHVPMPCRFLSKQTAAFRSVSSHFYFSVLSSDLYENEVYLYENISDEVYLYENISNEVYLYENEVLQFFAGKKKKKRWEVQCEREKVEVKR